MRRNDVPACEPEIPAFASTPNNAVVSSTEMFAAFAIGATYFIDSANFSISNAERENDNAITSVTRFVSDASKPNPRNVAPATSAARARSDPDACAKYNVASVTFVISLALKPSFANSTCSCATSFAVNMVDAPSCSAFARSFWNSSAVAPEIALTSDIFASKPLNTATDNVPIAAIGTEIDLVSDRPIDSNFLPVLSRARSALFNPPTNGAMFAKNRRFMDDKFISNRTFDCVPQLPHHVTTRASGLAVYFPTGTA